MIAATRRSWLALAYLLGAGALGNGLFMLWSPGDWYFAVPGVTSTGPFNPHFVRDIGLIFVGIGLALMVGAARPAARATLWGSAALWLSGHALFHVWEVAAGLCSPSALARDFPAVTLPALLALALAAVALVDASLRRASAPGEHAIEPVDDGGMIAAPRNGIVPPRDRQAPV